MNPDAMQGLATGNRGTKMEKREQTIYTPQSIIDVVLEVWPEGIALDPCHGPESIVAARAVYDDVMDGLGMPWLNRTYFNPPYADLCAWLGKAAEQRAQGAREQICLCPVRTNRPWFRHAWKHASARAGLDPVKFIGFKSGFPAPLCLLYWGDRVEAFERAVLAIGEPM